MSQKKQLLRTLEAKWNFLGTHESFQLAPVRTTLRLASWRIMCLLKKAAIIDLHRWDVRMSLPPYWKGVAKLIYAFRDYYEPELAFLGSRLSPGKTFVDAGANFGIYTLMACKTVGDAGRVISFEPSARAFPVLRHNIAINGFKNVHAFPVALADKPGKACLYHHSAVGSDALAKDRTFDPHAYAQEIETESLDNVLRRISVARVDAIKLDVQGAEELALRGGCEIVTSTRPVIMFEFHPEGAISLGLQPDGAWNLLASVGYDFFSIGKQGRVTRLQSPPATIANVIAIHRTQR